MKSLTLSSKRLYSSRSLPSSADITRRFDFFPSGDPSCQCCDPDSGFMSGSTSHNFKSLSSDSESSEFNCARLSLSTAILIQAMASCFSSITDIFKRNSGLSGRLRESESKALTWCSAFLIFVCPNACAASCWKPSPIRVEKLSVVPFSRMSWNTCDEACCFRKSKFFPYCCSTSWRDWILNLE